MRATVSLATWAGEGGGSMGGLCGAVPVRPGSLRCADPAAVDNAGRVPYAHAYLYTNNSARQARVLDLLAPVTPESKRVTAAQARALNKTWVQGLL